MLSKRLKEYYHFLKTLFKTNIRLLWGMWKLTKLPQPAITIFGSARVDPESLICKQARQFAKLLAAKEFSIITGGGPGIMNAANEGAIDHLKEEHLEGYLKNKEVISAGIGLIRLNKDFKNPFVQEYIETDHFFARKWLLVRYSVGFVIFPGGFGTLDELLEITTLIQCNRMPKTPVILIGSYYWTPFLDWVKNNSLREGFIDKQDVSIFTITDDIDEAANIILRVCQDMKQCSLRNDKNVIE